MYRYVHVHVDLERVDWYSSADMINQIAAPDDTVDSNLVDSTFDSGFLFILFDRDLLTFRSLDEFDIAKIC